MCLYIYKLPKLMCADQASSDETVLRSTHGVQDHAGKNWFWSDQPKNLSGAWWYQTHLSCALGCQNLLGRILVLLRVTFLAVEVAEIFGKKFYFQKNIGHFLYMVFEFCCKTIVPNKEDKNRSSVQQQILKVCLNRGLWWSSNKLGKCSSKNKKVT